MHEFDKEGRDHSNFDASAVIFVRRRAENRHPGREHHRSAPAHKRRRGRGAVEQRSEKSGAEMRRRDL